MDKITAIVQARIGSTRLPGKVMKLLCGKPVLRQVADRLKHSKKIDEIIVATTTLQEDDLIENFCLENKINYFRGSSQNVLSRYYNAAKKYNAKFIIRVTSDCPFIDPVVIDKMIDVFENENKTGIKIDYLSNTLHRTFPKGLDAEIFSFDSLKKAYEQAATDYDKEHVTPFLYNNPHLFKLKNYLNDTDYSSFRLTLDTPADYNLINRIYELLYKPNELILLDDLIDIIKNNNEIKKLHEKAKD